MTAETAIAFLETLRIPEGPKAGQRLRLAEFQRYQVEMPLVGLSSSDIRRRVAAGQSIRYRTPRAVETYIEAHGLYRAAE